MAINEGKCFITIGIRERRISNTHIIMKKILNYILSALFLIWELPQNILGAILLVFYVVFTEAIILDDGETVSVYTSGIRGGLSLGRFNFLQGGYYRNPSKYVKKTILHEKEGHSKQSRILGPFYLLVIGLPSLIWVSLWTCFKYFRKKDYYSFYTEKWADRLAGVER